jgi:2-haloacid dehalogenase
MVLPPASDMENLAINTIIFDLGGVLTAWNPVYLYRNIFPDEQEMKAFLENVCTFDWNEQQDAGRSLQEATDLLLAEYPHYSRQIQAYYSRWEEMLGGPIAGSVEILATLKRQGYRLYALTNWSSETFPIARQRHEFLSWFEGIVVSGEEKTRKPFPRMYQILLDRYQVNPAQALFIDDNARNVEGAKSCGLHGIHFHSPEQLREELAAYGIIRNE